MTWHNRNLYLIGLPGAGKSAIGRELADLIDGYSFIDLDSEIEQTSGHSVAHIFADKGESEFRELEAAALLRIASLEGKPKIVATGGGVVLRPINRAVMRGSGIPIWIDVTVGEAANNVYKDIEGGHRRPMLQGLSKEDLHKKLSALLNARRNYYEQALLHFVLRNVSGSARSAKELARELIIALDEMSLNVAFPPRHRTIMAKSAHGEYPIFVGGGIAARELCHFAQDRNYRAIIIVIDAEVARLYLEKFRLHIKQELQSVSVAEIIIESGEESKNLRAVMQILDCLNANDASRQHSLVLSLGGGVITDITGFAASLYHRGLPLLHIPTTLIAQADAAIGGKTGVNHFARKNSIGTFYSPSAVIADPLFLKTLAKRERLSGLAEVFKYALIGNREFWQSLSSCSQRLIRGIDGAYEAVILQSIQEKLRYVEKDEFERYQGVRELLNFGHTFGHALEAATDFKSLCHGEAVLYGMRAAAWLSKELGHLKEEVWEEIEVALGKIPIEEHGAPDLDVLLQAFLRDKKGKNRVILLRGIGEAFIAEVSEEDSRRAVQYMLTLL